MRFMTLCVEYSFPVLLWFVVVVFVVIDFFFKFDMWSPNEQIQMKFHFRLRFA